MKKTAIKIIALLLLSILALTIWVRYRAADVENAEVTWDFTLSRSTNVVAGPSKVQAGNRSDRDSGTRPFSKITVKVPNRPLLISTNPQHVYFSYSGGLVSSVRIQEEPMTEEEALGRIRSLAVIFRWPWDEQRYVAWLKGVKNNNPVSSGAGDAWNSKTVPHLSARIQHFPSRTNKEWFVELGIHWPEALEGN